METTLSAEEVYMSIQKKYPMELGACTTPSDWQIAAMKEYARIKILASDKWVDVRNDHPALEDDYETMEILADTGDYNNYEVVIYDGTDYFDKHRNNEDGNPLEITDKIQRWKYI